MLIHKSLLVFKSICQYMLTRFISFSKHSLFYFIFFDNDKHIHMTNTSNRNNRETEREDNRSNKTLRGFFFLFKF